jgi:DNA-binding MarR family transcriptional regulator
MTKRRARIGKLGRFPRVLFNFDFYFENQSIISWCGAILMSMKDSIQTLFHESEKMNESAMSLLRCSILTILYYYKDGLQYRELKAAFQISDGKLIHNLTQLVEFTYIEKDKIRFDNKQLAIYTLTSEGQKEIEKMSEWMKAVLEIINTE